MIQYKVQEEERVATAAIMTQIIYWNEIQYSHATKSYTEKLFTPRLK